jgi:hypothetical protein
MSTSTAIVPAGHSLFAEASRFLAAMFAAPDVKPPGNGGLALLRMSAGLNSVDPALFVERIVQD